ncbi:phospho-sugar mutase [Clostridium sp. UBA6640]|uniref:phospho-sugar mutase n=1 Tax=Clostridium sp. UBA6640 TaxID=1946370 RepID=UPI0025C4FBFC|nr:phospho-sugar mutase [Clostridium sp. UBA6640]
MKYREIYKSWIESDYFDEATKKELIDIESNEGEIEDRFYKDLEFGTAGLRGKIGAGTNRMNRYIIARASQGLADYINEVENKSADKSVAIAYDCRHFSEEFARTAASVLAANNIKAYIFDSLRPTPELSFAVRVLGCTAGIVVTASHNPKEYNGFKVYWKDGAQILSDIADGILNKINQINDFKAIPSMEIQSGTEEGLIVFLERDIDDLYLQKVKSLSLSEDIDKDINVVYTPLNGTGMVFVPRVLNERGFTNIHIVKEQKDPDPDFTTVGYPNPEDVNAFKLSIDLGKKVNADLLMATDPDCDRIAIMVKDKNNEYVAFNGNQSGAILVKYVLEGMNNKNILPPNGVIVKSIVTGDLGKTIAKSYGVHTDEALTGFKNICGKINEYEVEGSYQYILGYEESIGYNVGTFVRDKDGVTASMLLCEAAAYYKKRGKTLIDVLNEIYEEFGYYREKQISLVLEGISGQQRIKRMMEEYRREYPHSIENLKLIEAIDYTNPEETNMPYSDVLKFKFNDESWYAVRPSGTEPKIKIYIYTKGNDLKEAEDKINMISEVVLGKINSIE